MSGILYVIGTPIGNLGDITSRAIEILSEVDFIAAEDTRVTGKLLRAFDISKPMVSYHHHNRAERGMQIVERLKDGQSCGLITDAGTPCISDPGFELVNLCHENNIPVNSVPGPSAVTTALSVCGMSAERFIFEGFLPANSSHRVKRLEEIKDWPHTLVFYEAPHRLKSTLKDMLGVLGDRKIALVKELTKIYEGVTRTTLKDAADTIIPKGEFVIIVSGRTDEIVVDYAAALQAAAGIAARLHNDGIPLSQAAKEAAKETGIKKGDIYKFCIELSED